MRWNIKGLLLCHLLVFLLLGSFLWDVTNAYWEAFDLWCFKMLNHSLEGHLMLQKFWAWNNLRIADWIEDGIFLCFFFFYIQSQPSHLKLRKICELIPAILYGALIIFLNKLCFRSWIYLENLSPSLYLEHFIDVRPVFPDISVKIASNTSFPGDHGITAFFLPFTLLWLKARPRFLILSGIYTLFLCLPRMVVGAHWFSDLFVGSLSIVLLFSSYFFCSPLFNLLTSGLERCILYFKNKRSHEPSL